MRVILRDDESGVSEVIGTILILAMTVVLFATIIIWVSNIPTPAATARLDIEGDMVPLYDPFGIEVAGNITLRHVGGESLPAAVTSMSRSSGEAPSRRRLSRRVGSSRPRRSMRASDTDSWTARTRAGTPASAGASRTIRFGRRWTL